MKIPTRFVEFEKTGPAGEKCLVSMYIYGHAKLGHLPDGKGKKPPPGHFCKWIGGGYMH